MTGGAPDLDTVLLFSTAHHGPRDCSTLEAPTIAGCLTTPTLADTLLVQAYHQSYRSVEP
jgi:hypothetical protein